MFTVLSPATFRELVSGHWRGPRATLLRGALRVAEAPYTWAMRYRNRRYDQGHAQAFSVGVSVISVGNLTLGGTGKTPFVEWLARRLSEANLRVAIVSRGYGSKDGQPNDEALELALALPNVPHVQNPDRVAAAKEVINQQGAELILLDDGFQHRRMKRDLDIVLLDATEPFGFNHVFPRGTLREPVEGLKRADVVILTRADQLGAPERGAIQSQVKQLVPKATWCEVRHRIANLMNSDGLQVGSDKLAKKRVAAFCGIGNPVGFHHTLESIGCEIIKSREFPDHYLYTPSDVASLSAWGQDTDLLLTTRKDLVKLRVPSLGGAPLWAVGIETEFLVGHTEFETKLGEVIVPTKKSNLQG